MYTAFILKKLGFNKLFRKILNKKGLCIVPIIDEVKDLSNITQNPIEALYLAMNKSFFINIDIELCRLSLIGAKCNPNSSLPYIRIIRDIQENLKRNNELPYDKINSYFPGTSHENAASSLRINNIKIHKELLDAPPSDVIFPWNNYDVEVEKERYNESLIAQIETNCKLLTSSELMLAKKMNIEIWKLIQFKQCLNLYNSILEHGYNRSNQAQGDIQGNVLIKNSNDYVVHIYSGVHRMGVLTAMNRKFIPVRFNLNGRRNCIIRREDACLWPKVKKGVFSKKEALQIFDRIFEGVDY